MALRPRPLVLSGLGLLLSSCPAKHKPLHQPDVGDAGDDLDDPQIAGEDQGLVFTLREGRPEVAGGERPPVAAATPLGEREIQALLARLPALAAEAEDVKEFALRPASQPPPKTGTTVLGSFPGPRGGPPPKVEAGPLTVLRHTPDGEVPVAADLSVTFSEPMVAVTSRDALKAGEVPVKLSPAVPGEWQWVGTRTLTFRPTGRFQMATQYTVDVPAGTAAPGGSKLSQGTSFKFATPPPRLLAASPRDTTARRSPRIFLSFDQRIDPAAVLPSIQVAARRGKPVALRIVPRTEALRDKQLRDLVESAEEGRWLVVQPTEALPPDSEIAVVLAAGLASAEGPRKTTEAQEFTFRTYGALTLTTADCGWGAPECQPGMPFRFAFSNEIDARRFKKEWVRVEPAIPNQTVAAYGNEIQIQGSTKARQKYTVTIDPQLQDIYGQRLGAAEKKSFKVGPAPETLHSPVQIMTVLDPAAPAKLSVFTTGHKSLKVTIHAVTPADWDAYMTFLRLHNEDRLKRPALPGKQVFSDTIKIAGDPDESTETAIDLRAALPGNLGHAIVIVEPTTAPREAWMRSEVITWAQATRLGLDAFVDGEKMVAFATRLADGAAVPGVQLQLMPSGAKATSGADGLATLQLPPKGNRVLLATQGEDRAFLPEQYGWWYGDVDETGWRPQKRPDALHWFVFDDRQMYRPGETVKLKGWLRTRSSGLRGGLALPTAVKEVRYTLLDSQGNKLLTGTRGLNALGGFDLSLTLPKTPNLGYASLQFEVVSGAMKGQEWTHGLQIQEFRRPEYEVTARASEGPHLVGGHADLTVSAQYFAGGALANAEVQWSVSASPGRYNPPGHDDYTFGRWIPWWDIMWRGGPPGFRGDYRPPESFTGRTDAAGEHHLRADFVRVTPIEATSLHAEANVLDVNRQAWSASTDLLVHPASLYVGMKSDRLFVQQGEPLDIDAIVTDIDGKLVSGKDIDVRAVRLAWEQVDGEFKEVEKDAQACKKPATARPARCSFVPKEGGTFKVTASVVDDEGRRNESQLTLWVAGGDQPPSRDVAQEQVQLIPDKKEYAAGDTARLLVIAPFAPAEAVVSLRREGLISTRRISLKTTSTTIDVPIEDAYAPNIHVQVDLVGSAARTQDNGRPDPKLPRRPAYAMGEIGLPVSLRSRSLNLYLKPGADKLEPGGSTSLEVLVHDSKDQPVRGSEVAVVVVDEAVLALSSYQLADPLAVFFPQLDPGVGDAHSRGVLTLARPQDATVEGGVAGGMVGGAPQAEMAPTTAAGAPPPPPSPPEEAPSDARRVSKNAPAGADRDGGALAPAIAVRSNFDALALFAAALPTDAQGRARVDIKLPDNLTRYRVMAVAVAGADRFGKAESAITARLPLMVRPSAPRFLNYGDRFELPFVVQNQTDAPMTVELAARAANLDLTQGAGRKVQVPANDRVEVRLPAAAVRPGTARFQVAASAGKWSDAASGQLPVWTPATTEAFATYGQIDAGPVAQPVRPPPDAVPGFGGLELTTSSTALAELTDAVLYLVRYPYECSEQLASRTITIAALRDVLVTFEAEGLPKPAELLAFVTADLERLERLQNPDGGFAFWRRGDPSWPYLSIHVAHALERARSKGFKVSPAVLDRAQDYLKTIETKFEPWYTPEVKRPIVAYALYVRNRLGVRDQTRARSLLKEVALEKHSLETLGWLLPVLGSDSPESQGMLRHIANQVRETAGAAHFTTGYSDGGHLLLHSERRVDGVLLEALIGAEPKSDLIPKLVRGLLAQRTSGRWNNTQENAFVLLALDRYFATYEKVTPDFLARAWLGSKSAGEHRFRGRTTEQHHTVVPMPALLKEGDADLVLAKDGPGRLYYRLGLRYAPKDLSLKPADFGFAVERTYAALDDPKDVRRDPDGTWRIKAGARVQVSLTMVAQDRRYHVALVDPLPAGLEAINPALATSGSAADPDEESSSGGGRPSPFKRAWSWWWGPWYEHQNLRDERVEAFTTLLWDGVHRYSYVARATTPGNFVVPPAKAEEMYAPETFGRSGSDRVIVE